MLGTSLHTASCLPSISENMLSPSCSPYFGQHGFRGFSFQIEGVPEVLREAKAIISCHMIDKAFRIGYRTFRIEQSMSAIGEIEVHHGHAVARTWATPCIRFAKVLVWLSITFQFRSSSSGTVCSEWLDIVRRVSVHDVADHVGSLRCRYGDIDWLSTPLPPGVPCPWPSPRYRLVTRCGILFFGRLLTIAAIVVVESDLNMKDIRE